ncbi:MAG: glycoside hydrolase family 3 protein [Spirochaetaceae bacterium]|jgi:beta-N-acetylhexosaminidase|nr:glycoside hydrolase family 3 protein [Spirochaetaceae bacterium]
MSAKFRAKHKFFSGAFFLAGIFVAAAPAPVQLPDAVDFWSDYPAEILAHTLVDRMTDEELYAQILMFGWAGQEPSNLLNRWVEQRGLGSVKLFGWNTDDTLQVARSVTALQQKAASLRFKIPLFVATDQEGGSIRHIKGATSFTPGNLAIGASGYPADAWYSGYYIGRELRALGINMNFAPTIDVYSNRDSTVIGPRSFGDNPDTSGILGAQFAAGSIAAGVIPTAKHFPGHGDTGMDSHGRLPVITVDRATFEKRELLPFKHLIAGNVPAIMSGHLTFPNVVNDGAPASLSRPFLTDFLRGELGFQGLIITDDMRMNGATVYAGSLSEAYRMAIQAGNDIIISSTTATLEEPCWRANLDRLRTDLSFRETVKKAARRVVRAKLDYFKGDNPVPVFPQINAIPSLIPDPEGEDFFLNLACRSITLAKAGAAFPTPPARSARILLAGRDPAFFAAAKARYTAAAEFHIPFDFSPSLGSRLENAATNVDTVIICVETESDASLAITLRDRAVRVVVVSSLSPFPALPLESWADTILYAYSTSPYSFEAAIAAIAGDYAPQGTLPIER